MRVTPWARSSPSRAASTLSGLASDVTSAPGASPNSASMARRMRAERGRGQQGRRSAAEEHRAHRDLLGTERGPREGDLGDREARVGLRRDGGAAGAPAELGGGVGVEVAVAAAGHAERHVHVDPERPLAQPAARALRQAPVGGHGLAVGQCARHASHATRSHATRLPEVSGWRARGVIGGTGSPPYAGGHRGVVPRGQDRLDWKDRVHGRRVYRVYGRHRWQITSGSGRPSTPGTRRTPPRSRRPPPLRPGRLPGTAADRLPGAPAARRLPDAPGADRLPGGSGAAGPADRVPGRDEPGDARGLHGPGACGRRAEGRVRRGPALPGGVQRPDGAGVRRPHVRRTGRADGRPARGAVPDGLAGTRLPAAAPAGATQARTRWPSPRWCWAWPSSSPPG